MNHTKIRSTIFTILLSAALLTVSFFLWGHTAVRAEAAASDSASLAPALTDTCLTVKVGQPQQLPLDGADSEQGLLFSVNDPELCTVDPSGTVTGQKPGVVTVSATSPTGQITNYLIEVVDPAEKLRLSRSSVTIQPGNTHQLDYQIIPVTAGKQELTWTTNEPGIASVQNGLITAHKKGMALITAETTDGIRSYCIVNVATPPQAVTLSETSLQLSEGDSAALNPLVLPKNADTSLRWESKDPSVAAVDENGVVTALKSGTTLITVMTDNRRSASVTVEVLPAVSSIAISSHVLNLGLGETYALRTILAPANAFNKTLTWKSSNANIVAVRDGLLTAKAPGSATITVSTANGKTATCQVTVKNPPTEFSVLPRQFALGEGESYQLKLSFPDQTAAAGAGYTSANPEICQVSSDGTLTAVKVGYTEITARLYNGTTAVSMVWVEKAPTAITVSKSSYTLAVGSTQKLLTRVEGASFTKTYLSADDKIVAVSSDGYLIAKSAGTTTVTVSTYNHQTVSFPVTVKPLPASVSISDHLLNLGLGEVYSLKTIISPSDAMNTALTWKSSTPGTVTVQNGVLTAKALGNATITASTANGKTATCQVTVKKAAGSVTLEPQQIILGAGEAYRMKALLPADTAAANLNYSSDNSSVCTVNSNGIVTGVKAGTATVTVSLFNGKKATAAIQIKPAPTSVTLEQNRFTLGVGESVRLKAIIGQQYASHTITYSSANNQVASVNATGTITAKGVGTTTITVSTFNKVTATCTVTVKQAPASVTLSPSTVSVLVNTTAKLTPKVNDASACSAFTFTSYDTSICTVSAGGVITGKKPGRTTVMVSTYNGMTEFCDVVVRKGADSLQLYVKKRTLKPGKTLRLWYYFTPSGTQETVAFSSNNTKVCTVDQKGNVTAVAEGTAVITATSQSGKKSTCTITVTNNAAQLSKDAANRGPLYEHFATVCQYPELPTGCEITALTMVLNFLGYAVDKCTLSDDYLEKGPAWSADFHEVFAGEPRSSYSYGCYAPAIVKAANQYLTEKKSSYRARELDHFAFDDLFHFTENGIPVLVWTTIDLLPGYYTASWEANGKTVTWYANEHCMVLLGQSGSRVYTGDPTTGKIVSYDKDLFRTRYQELFSQSVVIQ